MADYSGSEAYRELVIDDISISCERQLSSQPSTYPPAKGLRTGSTELMAAERRSPMRLSYKVALLLTMALLLFVSGSLAKRLDGIISAEIQNGDSPLIDVQSVSGKITAVQDNTFTIEIPHVKPPGASFLQEDHPSSMTFLINSSTKIEGKLKVGANADVLYRRQGGNNIAVTVRVTAIS